MRNPILILATAIAGGALALGLWSWQQWAQNQPGKKASLVETATVLPAPRPLPDVMLVNQSGQQTSAIEVSKNWSLWFFGFTHCPDVCPNTLGLLAAVRTGLSSETDIPLDLVFFSVDPERDTPQKLAEYVSYFDEQMLAVTGNTLAIDRVTSALYLPYIINEPDSNGQYDVEHSGSLVLVNPGGQAVAYFTPPHQPSTLINDLSTLLNTGS